MKVSQLEEGQTYQNKKGLRRTIRQITSSAESFTPNTVYYIEQGSNFVHTAPKQEFAEWAKTTAAPFKQGW